MSLFLSEIRRYPIKSCRGESLLSASLDDLGIEGDRRWMLVDANGDFLSIREVPRMTLIQAKILHGQLLLRWPGQGFHSPEFSTQAITVQVWKDQVQAWEDISGLSQKISEFLDTPCRLVFMPLDSKRKVEAENLLNTHHTALSDGYPLMLLSEASLSDLNTRLENPVTMERFRPNLVVSGAQAFEEDRWKRIRIGEIEFEVVKPCPRCSIPTVDPETGEMGIEPMKTLASYRSQDHKVLFGQNMVHYGVGTVKVGYGIEVLEWHFE